MFTDPPVRTAQLNVRLTPAERAFVAEVAARRGLTAGQLVRRGVQLVLASGEAEGGGEVSHPEP